MRVFALLVAAAVVVPVLSTSLPMVDLDYTTVQAVGGNTTVGYYKYQNIRFAAVPTGDLRFAAPEMPPQENETNTGTNLADADVACTSTEDCLYLDLYPEDDYTSAGLRFADMKQSLDLTAKNLALTNALKNTTWNAECALGSATHGADQSYYWYSTYTLSTSSSISRRAQATDLASSYYANVSAASAGIGSALEGSFGGMAGAGGAGGESSVNSTIAIMMQKYLLSFVITGNPNTMWPDDRLYWPQYNESSVGTEIVFNDTFTVADDDLANSKSLFWNKALWY
ncbi:hypothetical protein PPTG_02134 [Phytophthora nicotianae INRA-310]|uniref:Carboxylesterase type B domain-containing protein n=1 Tax=Phytophthora nicotianae (strain INRA-310) TaxID=761204 RepID=W2R9M5_PHYN3|nr:hypothetical protein PPTG_02134 [Phytophthora nicotianae INRA-310]ETN22092.1 hypothetical protein PPTG_02134 [Phytophthora nicotianae INRA-310]